MEPQNRNGKKHFSVAYSMVYNSCIRLFIDYLFHTLYVVDIGGKWVGHTAMNN